MQAGGLSRTVSSVNYGIRPGCRNLFLYLKRSKLDKRKYWKMKRIFFKLSNHVWGLLIRTWFATRKLKEIVSSFSWHCCLCYYTLRTFQTFINKIIFIPYAFKIYSNFPNSIYFSPFKPWVDNLCKEILPGHIWSNNFEIFQTMSPRVQIFPNWPWLKF